MYKKTVIQRKKSCYIFLLYQNLAARQYANIDK